jgi:hypothetical protein
MDLYRRISPVHHVERITIPLLLAVGDKDTRLADTLRFYQALHEAGQSVKLVRYPDEGHEIASSSVAEQHLQMAIDFLESHFRPSRQLASDSNRHSMAVTNFGEGYLYRGNQFLVKYQESFHAFNRNTTSYPRVTPDSADRNLSPMRRSHNVRLPESGAANSRTARASTPSVIRPKCAE